MVVNGQALLRFAPIKDMLDHKATDHGVSYGLSEAGYDIRLKQDILFSPKEADGLCTRLFDGRIYEWREGKFCLASAIEEFQMPAELVGIVHDKSTWARKGLSVFNTVIEPKWNGFLTLELVYHGHEDLHIPAGSGIAQVIFHQLILPGEYSGKYQGQEDRPVDSKFE